MDSLIQKTVARKDFSIFSDEMTWQEKAKRDQDIKKLAKADRLLKDSLSCGHYVPDEDIPLIWPAVRSIYHSFDIWTSTAEDITNAFEDYGELSRLSREQKECMGRLIHGLLILKP